MAESVFLLPRLLDDGVLKRKSIVTAFGTAGQSVSVKQGRLYKIRLMNNAAATKYFVQLHDKATAPIAADVPIWEAQVAAVSDYVEDWGLFGLYFANGIGLAISTTSASLTLAGATDAAGAFLEFTVQT